MIELIWSKALENGISTFCRDLMRFQIMFFQVVATSIYTSKWILFRK